MKTSINSQNKKGRFDKKAYNHQVKCFEDIRLQLNLISKNYHEMGLPVLSSSAEFFRLLDDTEKKLIEINSGGEFLKADEELILVDGKYFEDFCNQLRAINKHGITSAIASQGLRFLSAFSRKKNNNEEFWLAAVAIKEIFDYNNGQVNFKKDFHEAFKLFFVS